MSGHYKFSRLTEHFSEERQAEIAQKTVHFRIKVALGEYCPYFKITKFLRQILKTCRIL